MPICKVGFQNLFMNKKKLSLLLIVVSLLSACNKTTPKATPTSAPVMIKKQNLTNVVFETNPTVSLTARPDGHELTMTIKNIPSEVTKFDYELLYKAKDGKTEIEKGLGDTINTITNPIERKLLLGTASCTNGCKYRYDEGVTGGTLKITYLTNNNGVNVYQSEWSISKNGKIFTVNLGKQ